MKRRAFLQILGLGVSAWASSVDAQHFDVTWVGGPTMVIQFDGLTILTDPTLGNAFDMGDPNDASDYMTVRKHQRLTPLPKIDLKSVDLVLLSHVHEDHFDQQAWADLDHTLPVILPIADVETVRGKGFTQLDGLKWNDTRQLKTPTGIVKITATVARHSRDPKVAKTLGAGNGYWIELSTGAWKRTLYWTGDSMPTSEVVDAIKSRGSLDLLVPHVGGVGSTGPFGQISMGAADVIELARALHPRYVLPIHHTTYAFYLEPISRLAERSSGQPFRLDLIQAGATVTYR